MTYEAPDSTSKKFQYFFTVTNVTKNLCIFLILRYEAEQLQATSFTIYNVFIIAENYSKKKCVPR
jgi:hypothetical protein